MLILTGFLHESDRIQAMFTGIIQTVGEIKQLTPIGADVKLVIAATHLQMHDVQQGDSISVNGVCLTVTHLQDDTFEAHVSKETLSVTVGLDHLHTVNLEKALRLSDRLGGHLVSGHVDGVGQIVKFQPVGECWLLSVRVPHALAKYIAVKGSIAIDGVSLTINSIEKDVFNINLIPHTVENTAFKQLGIGSRVNIEIDQIARYVERMTEWRTEDELA